MFGESETPDDTATLARRALADVTTDNLRRVLVPIGVVYAVAAVAHLPLLPVEPSPAFAFVLALASAWHFALAALLRHWRPEGSSSHALSASVILVGLLVAAFGAFVLERTHVETSLAVCLFAAAILVHSERWMAAIVAACLALAVALAALAPEQATRDALTLQGAAALVAFTLQRIHLRRALRYETIRITDERQSRLLREQQRDLEVAVGLAQESRERYQTLVEGVPVGVYRSTPDGRFLEINGTAARLLGYADRDEALSRPVQTLYVDPTERREWAERLERDGALHGWETQVRRADGSLVWVRDSARILRDDAGAVVCYEGVVEDITARKEAERALEESRHALAHNEKLSALGTLVAGVAHEINNPLTYMRGGVELNMIALDELLAQEDDDVAHEALRDMLEREAAVLRGIERIAHITTSLKTVARSRAQERTVEDTSRLVDNVLTVASSRLPDDVDVAADLRAKRPVYANSGEIAQVLLNLVFNAADAMAEGGRLSIRSHDEGDDVVLEVEDTGPGIPADQAHKLFTPFHTTKPGGTGLGLSVSHSIAKAHGGALSFQSAPGRGTTFVLRLPAAPATPSGAHPPAPSAR